MHSLRAGLFLLFLVMLHNSLPAQGILYGLQCDHSGQSLQVTTFNLITHNYDTVYTLPSNYATNTGSVYGNSMDIYNHRYFFSTNYGSCVYNMNSMQFSGTGGGVGCLSQHYDQFWNALIYKYSNTIEAYFLDGTGSRTIMQVPRTYGCYTGRVSAYNSRDQQFFYECIRGTYPADTAYWMLVDLPSASVLVEAAMPDSMVFGNLQYCPLTNRYLGVGGSRSPFYGMALGLYEVDPLSLTATKVTDLPADYDANLNYQNSTYDDVTNRYILPYVTQSMINKIAIYNFGNGAPLQTLVYPGEPNENQILSIPVSSSLVYRNNKLWATKGEMYSWYLNGVLLCDTDNNQFTPPQSGEYWVDVRIGKAIYSSNTVNVTISDLKTVEDANCMIYPNPAHDFVFAKFNQPFTQAQLFSTEGCSLKTILLNGKSEMKMPVGDLPSGVYFLKCYGTTGTSTKKVSIRN